MFHPIVSYEGHADELEQEIVKVIPEGIRDKSRLVFEIEHFFNGFAPWQVLGSRTCQVLSESEFDCKLYGGCRSQG